MIRSRYGEPGIRKKAEGDPVACQEKPDGGPGKDRLPQSGGFRVQVAEGSIFDSVPDKLVWSDHV